MRNKMVLDTIYRHDQSYRVKAESCCFPCDGVYLLYSDMYWQADQLVGEKRHHMTYKRTLRQL